MALDELFKTFEFLKKRIEEHREYLEHDETRTRQVLIDPLLKELGWDVGDPNAVELEHRIDKQFDVGMNRADYVLKSGPKLAAVIEAKKLDSPLMDKATTQVLNYANAKGIPWMLVSDGNKWTMYEVFKQGELSQRVRMSFVVSESAASECALKALALWNPNVCAIGGPVDAVEPVIGMVVPPPPPPNCVPLPQLKPTGRKPARIKLHDGRTSEVNAWSGVLTEIVNALVRDRKLTRRTLANAKQGSRLVRYVNVEPRTPDGRDFKGPVSIEEGMWLDRFGSAVSNVEKSMVILNDCGVDSEDVCVELA